MWSDLHHFLTFGPLQSGWKDLGGPVCLNEIPFHVHALESSSWLILAAIYYRIVDLPAQLKSFIGVLDRELNARRISALQRAVEVFFGVVHVLVFLAIFRFKMISKALAFIIQPCHIICFCEGIALFSKGPLGVLITIAVLPAMVGTISALLFPENSDLTLSYEVETFWVEHWLIVLTPLYLLVRHDAVALKHINAVTIMTGLWILLTMHFSLHEIVSYSLMVNVEFMLCPTEQMDNLLKTLIPSLYDWLTHRSLITLFVLVGGTLISYFYIFVAHILHRAFSRDGSLAKLKSL